MGALIRSEFDALVRNHSFSMYVFQKTNISDPLIGKRMCTYQRQDMLLFRKIFRTQ